MLSGVLLSSKEPVAGAASAADSCPPVGEKGCAAAACPWPL